MKSMHISSQVENRIEDLKHAGKAGKALAQKATRIIESLASGDVRKHMDAIDSYTKRGEKRIKNCRKYDLGCGFRLIFLTRGLKAFILFLGTHDECQRWLENKSRLKEVAPVKGTLIPISHTNPSRQCPSNKNSADSEADAEDNAPLELSEQTLRRVFHGLVQAAGKGSS